MGTISVSLAADGTTADVADVNTPITTIVNAINGGLDNANIASGAAIATSKLADDAGITGAKLATNAVAAANIATTAITLGYASITSNFTTTSTTAAQVTGLTLTVTIPAGNRKVKITGFASDVFASTSAIYVLSIWDGVPNVGTQLARALVNNGGTSGITVPGMVQVIVTPSAGSKTYNIGFQTSAGTGTLEAGANYPAFILVEAI